MLGKRLRLLLKNRNISQAVLSKELGYTQQAINRWCNNQAQPDNATIVKIANYFGVSTDYLLGNELNDNLRDEIFKEKEALRNALINSGYMKENEDISDEELERLMKFIKNNKDFIKKC